MNKEIAIIGLGYVGLPLAVEFAKKYKVVGFDINTKRVEELNAGHDSTLEVSDENLKTALSDDITGLIMSSDISAIKNCTVFIVTVPTPLDKNNKDWVSMAKSNRNIIHQGQGIQLQEYVKTITDKNI